MDDDRRRGALRVCGMFQSGILTAEEACRTVLFFCVEPGRAGEYVALLPDELRVTLGEFLPTLPTGDDGWATYHRGIGQLDGDERSWARMICEGRANAEAVRGYLSGEASPPPAPDFAERVRAYHRARMAEFARSMELRRPRDAGPGGGA